MTESNYIAIAALCVSALTFAWTIGLSIARSDGALRNRIDGVLYDLNQLGGKVRALETKVESLPKHEDIGKIYGEIRNVTKTISTVSEQLASATATLEGVKESTLRMDTYLRNTA